MATAVLHAQELLGPLVELVVADGGDVETNGVHRLDARLIMEERGHERRRADDVAGGDDERVWVFSPELLDVRSEILGAAGFFEVDGGVRSRDDLPRRARRRLEVAVEVVEREELHVDDAAAVRARRRRVPPELTERGVRDVGNRIEFCEGREDLIVERPCAAVFAGAGRGDRLGRAGVEGGAFVELVDRGFVGSAEDRAGFVGALADSAKLGAKLVCALVDRVRRAGAGHDKTR